MEGSRIAVVGAALADETRSMLLAALMAGTAHTAGELARFCGVAPSTMSKHLARLIDSGLVVAEPAGRYRYYRLANSDVAALLEQIDAIDLPELTPPRRPNPGTELADARGCYDHIAGTLGVEIFDSMLARNYLTPTHDPAQLTPAGCVFIDQLGIDVGTLEQARRPTIRACLDWTERKHHLGGGLGAGFLELMVSNRWLTRRHDQRILRLTNRGRDAIRTHFAIG
ncbi:MAG: winged helix-turn-helix transcriptional regulator [bacterium]|nr:winged helix-turn-helix transcriptional regulator [bacterium]